MDKSYAEISLIFGKNFIRVCKDHVGVYKIFRKNLNRNLQTHMGRHQNFTDLCNANTKTLNDRLKEIRHFRDPYEPVAFLTNNLLANYIERDCPNKQVLPILGQAIFDASCNEIFGNQFQKDILEEEQRLNIPQAKSDFDLFCLSLFATYSAANKGVKFDEFMNENRDKLMKMYQHQNPFNHMQREENILPDWLNYDIDDDDDDAYNNDDEAYDEYNDEQNEEDGYDMNLDNDEPFGVDNGQNEADNNVNADDEFARLFHNN